MTPYFASGLEVDSHETTQAVSVQLVGLTVNFMRDGGGPDAVPDAHRVVAQVLGGEVRDGERDLVVGFLAVELESAFPPGGGVELLAPEFGAALQPRNSLKKQKNREEWRCGRKLTRQESERHKSVSSGAVRKFSGVAVTAPPAPSRPLSSQSIPPTTLQVLLWRSGRGTRCGRIRTTLHLIVPCSSSQVRYVIYWAVPHLWRRLCLYGTGDCDLGTTSGLPVPLAHFVRTGCLRGI